MFKTSQISFYRNDELQRRRPPDVCLYTSVPRFEKQREAAGVVHIGVGFLRCSFPVAGIAKALNTERTKVRFPRLFYIYSSKVTFTKISSPTGIWAKHTALYGYDSCRTAYRTYSSRPRTQRHLVRCPIVLYPSQCL